MGREENTIVILGIDPSGSFKEGDGTTGWTLVKRTDNEVKLLMSGEISAHHWKSPEEYWAQHPRLIDDLREVSKMHSPDFRVALEAYILYATKAKAQINSEMETSQLIGIIRHHCHMKGIALNRRTASIVMNRWSDKILQHKGYDLTGMCAHIKDALRHATHDAYFGDW